MAWNIDNVATHCFYCGEPLDVGGLHGTQAVYFNGHFVCRVFSHADCMDKYEKELKDEMHELKEKHKTEVKELLYLIRDKENNFNRAFDSEEKEIRHQKYKRCLAMAERCKDKIENAVQYDEHDDWLIINEYWERWHERWLELAEKIKEKIRNISKPKPIFVSTPKKGGIDLVKIDDMKSFNAEIDEGKLLCGFKLKG